MKRMILLAAILCLTALAADNAAVAPKSATSLNPQAPSYKADAVTIPHMLSYQGLLTDTAGRPVPNGNYSVMFKLYTVPSGGSSFWGETQSVTTRDGLFSVLLGSVTPIGSVPDAGALYLGMAVGGGAELVPRLRIVSAAYSYKADTANYALASAGGGGTVTNVSQATGIVCTPNPITATGTVRLDSVYTDGRYIRNQNSSAQSADFRIAGTGQATQFIGSSVAAGASAISGDGGAYAHGVYGLCSTASYSAVYGDGRTVSDGVGGRTNTSNGFGVQARNNHSTGTGIIASGNGATPHYLSAGSGGAFTGKYYGSYHRATDDSGTAVVGLGNNVTVRTYPTGSGGAFAGTVCGGYGEATNTSGNTYGLYGQVSNTLGFGAYGTNSNTGGTGVAGVGNNTTAYQLTAGSGGAFSGTEYGLFARANNANSGAAYFYNEHGTTVRVAYYNGTTEYKILGDGTVSTTMPTRGGKKILFAPEMPEAYFEDAGEGQLVDGRCRVNLERLFSDCIAADAGHPLKVFVQLEDDCNGVYVKKDLTGFDVCELQGGKSDARFSWRVLAKWKGNENVRLPDAPGPLPTVKVESPRAAGRQIEAVPVPEPREATQTAPAGQQ